MPAALLALGGVGAWAPAAEGADEARAAIGFRGDGWRGIFPADARPPTEFDAVAGQNLVWKTPLPNFGNASPIVVGRKVFAVCEPGWPEGTDVPVLLCVDADTGKTLWQRLIDPYDAWPPERAASARALRRAYFAWRFKLNRAVFAAGRGDAKAREVARSLVGKDSAKLDELLAETPDARAVAGLLRSAPMARALRDIGFDPTPTWGWMCIGVAMPTPASDGKRIFAATGYKTMSAFDLDGNRLWHVFHADVDYRQVRHQWIESCAHSPIVVGDRVLMHLWDRVWCYSTATGQVLWATPAPPMPEHSMGQPVILRLPAPEGPVPAIFCISGQLIRIRDGKLLADKVGWFRTCAAIGSDGRDLVVGYNGGSGGYTPPPPERRWGDRNTGVAVRFRLGAGGERAEAELAWQKELRTLGAYPVLLGGRLVTDGGLVLALADGSAFAAAKRRAPDMAYNGMILAGGHLFGQPQFKKMEAVRGENTIVVRVARLGETVEVLGECPLETGDPATDPDPTRRDKIVAQTGDARWRSWYGWHEAYAAPFASGNRLFVRTFDYLYCFGDKGRAFVPSLAFQPASEERR
jgi:hypothetical protein